MQRVHTTMEEQFEAVFSALSTSKIRLSDLSNNLPRLEGRVKHERKLRELLQLTQYPLLKRQLIGSPNL